MTYTCDCARLGWRASCVLGGFAMMPAFAMPIAERAFSPGLPAGKGRSRMERADPGNSFAPGVMI
jgi:hypothetical protein